MSSPDSIDPTGWRDLKGNRGTAAWLPPFCVSEYDVLDTAAAWLAAGHDVALGTVVRTAGSAPRQLGSHIAVRDDGAFAGSVSAGCVEGAVVEEALAALKDGKVRRLAFGVADDGTFAVGLMCGGQIEVLIEAIQ